MDLHEILKVSPAGGPVNPLLLFGFILVIGAAGGWLAGRLRLPTLTGNILAGILIGPVLGIAGDKETLERLMPLNQFAIGLITVAIGSHLSWYRIHNALRRILSIALLETTLTAILVTAAVLLAAKVAWPAALLLGILAVSTAPATIIHVSRESRAKGPFVKTLLSVVALDNIVAITLFALALPPLCEYWRTGVVQIGAVAWLEPLWHLVGSVGLGLAAGWTAEHLAQRRGLHNFSTVFVTILVCTGLSVRLGLSPLLASLFLGIYLGNRSCGTAQLLGVLEPIELILFTAFFTLAGAAMHLEMLPAAGLAGVLFIVFRLAGKAAGSVAGGILARTSPRIFGNMPLGLVPQAGLAIALVVLVDGDARIPPEVRSLVTTLVLAAVVVNEIIGPFAARLALKRSGEVGKDRSRLVEFLQEEHIKVGLKAADKWDAMNQLCDFLLRAHCATHIKKAVLLERCMAREMSWTQAVGAETAIIHGRIASGPAIQGVLGICAKGVDFGAPDGLPVRLILMIVTPRDHEERHLEVLAGLAAMAADEVIRSRLKAARDANEAWEIIESRETPDYNSFLED